MTTEPSKRQTQGIQEMDELEAQWPWAEAIDHKFCKRCEPHATQLSLLFGRALRITRLLRGVKP